MAESAPCASAATGSPTELPEMAATAAPWRGGAAAAAASAAGCRIVVVAVGGRLGSASAASAAATAVGCRIAAVAVGRLSALPPPPPLPPDLLCLLTVLGLQLSPGSHGSCSWFTEVECGGGGRGGGGGGG